MHREKQLNKHILANRTAGMELVLIGSLPYQQKSLRYVVRCFKKKKHNTSLIRRNYSTDRK